VARGQQAEAEQRFAAALADYQRLAQTDGTFAELVYRRARCELMLQQRETANADFRLARDLDTLRFRADSRLNGIIRETAAARKVVLIDTEQACDEKSGTLWKASLPEQKGRVVPGEELFYDHVHLNFAGNYLVATLVAAEVEKAVFGPGAAARGPGLSESEVARRLAFTQFDQQRVGEEMRLRLQQAPFVSQSNFRERDARWQQTLASPQTPVAGCLEAYRQALALAPQDWVLRANFARVLEAAEDAAGAREQWLEVTRLMPHEPDGWFQLGDLAYSAQRYAEADRWFQTALQRKSDCTEALNGLGLVYAAQGQSRAAMQQFETALRLAPRSTAARVNLAVVLANSGDIPAAKAHYQRILLQDTNHVGARVNLAKLLAGQGEKTQAIALYQEAVQLKPDDPVVHYDLGNALAEENRHAEALSHYAAAVQARPDFAEARYHLALELTRLGRVREAATELAEVVRLKPGWADAHYNYGIALAREQRLGEAVPQFQETLKLQPGHAAAHASLQRARQLMAQAR
ncbi:MAG TPA: tetratricopeptide repeat protein, partial [Bacillota bacterium]|nr:tetratricopeptide repeat protein [Bacillota bacterium]